jgi:hypothetical protein
LVVIASTMRSGSTLLKALLANAPDISNLPEVNFQRWNAPRFAVTVDEIPQLARLASERIVVLKRPAWYHEGGRYPRFPAIPGTKAILLVREPYDTVQSLRKMVFGFAERVMSPWVDRWLLKRYWQPVTETLLELGSQGKDEYHLVSYEALVRQPTLVTRGLFRFVGSQQLQGCDTYQPPRGRRWRWGTDDNSVKIRSLQVKPPRPTVGGPENRRLQDWIDGDPTIQQVLARLKQLQTNSTQAVATPRSDNAS